MHPFYHTVIIFLFSSKEKYKKKMMLYKKKEDRNSVSVTLDGLSCCWAFFCCCCPLFGHAHNDIKTIIKWISNMTRMSHYFHYQKRGIRKRKEKEKKCMSRVLFAKLSKFRRRTKYAIQGFNLKRRQNKNKYICSEAPL